MKKTLIGLVLAAIVVLGSVGVSEAAVRVRGYYKPSTGRYVAPSYRTSPNRFLFDNYSTKGNYNPYTGKKGYVSPFRW